MEAEATGYVPGWPKPGEKLILEMFNPDHSQAVEVTHLEFSESHGWHVVAKCALVIDGVQRGPNQRVMLSLDKFTELTKDFRAMRGTEMSTGTSFAMQLEQLSDTVAVIRDFRDKLDAINEIALATVKDPASPGQCRWSVAYRNVLDLRMRYDMLKDEMNSILKRLSDEQGHDGSYNGGRTPLDTLCRLLDDKREKVATAINNCRVFADDMRAFLKAFSLMLGTVGSATTHAEKAARLRGLVELVDSAADKIRTMHFEEFRTFSYAIKEDVFRCDYPVRHWVDRCRELEAENKRLADAVLRPTSPAHEG